MGYVGGFPRVNPPKEIRDKGEEEVPVEDIEEAVDEYVDNMSLDDALTYVRSNMKNYYIDVADAEEAQEFLE